MSGSRIVAVSVLVSCLLVITAAANADVTHKTMNELKLSGTMSFITKLFGWGHPSYEVAYYMGHKVRTDYLDDKGEKPERSEIIDLDNELFINIDHKKKRYTQMTFEEWREMIRKAMEQYSSQAEEMKKSQQESGDEMLRIEYRINVDHTGEIEDINGFQAEKVIITMEPATMTSGEEDGEAESMGGMAVVSTHWVVDELYGSDEIKEFAKLMVEKMGMIPEVAKMSQMTEMIFMSNPALGDAVQQITQAMNEVGGHDVRVVTSIGSMEQTESSEAPPQESSGGGLFGKVGGRLLGGNKDKKDDDENSTLFYEQRTEVYVQEGTELDPKLFDVPTNYKLQK